LDCKYNARHLTGKEEQEMKTIMELQEVQIKKEETLPQV
jgi:hypothetical protein